MSVSLLNTFIKVAVASSIMVMLSAFAIGASLIGEMVTCKLAVASAPLLSDTLYDTIATPWVLGAELY